MTSDSHDPENADCPRHSMEGLFETVPGKTGLQHVFICTCKPQSDARVDEIRAAFDRDKIYPGETVGDLLTHIAAQKLKLEAANERSSALPAMLTKASIELDQFRTELEASNKMGGKQLLEINRVEDECNQLQTENAALKAENARLVDRIRIAALLKERES